MSTLYLVTFCLHPAINKFYGSVLCIGQTLRTKKHGQWDIGIHTIRDRSSHCSWFIN